LTLSTVEHIDLREPWLTLGGYGLTSRLIVGIEQYTSPAMVRQVLEATESRVFITTVDPDNRRASLQLSDLAGELPLDEYLWVGTTSFARSADSALRTAQILRDSYGIDIIKLDVRDDDNRPANRATVEVAAKLREQGVTVLPFIVPDEADALDLQMMGCAAVRVMAAPVASGQGVLDPALIRRIIERLSIPVVVEGGLGSARHVTLAMELGASAVLVNTALTVARQPLRMAAAMRLAVHAGRLSYLAGPMAAAEIG
jgi:thiazole synthase